MKKVEVKRKVHMLVVGSGKLNHYEHVQGKLTFIGAEDLRPLIHMKPEQDMTDMEVVDEDGIPF